MKLPGFIAHVAELQQTATDGAMRQLQVGLTEAAETLRALLTHSEPWVRFKAAAKLLDIGTVPRGRANVKPGDDKPGDDDGGGKDGCDK